MRVFYLSAITIFLLDRISKYLVLKAEYQLVEVLPFFNLVKVWNKGIAFGLLRNSPNLFDLLLLLLTPLILGMLFYIARKSAQRDKIFLGMVFGGGLSNWIDRISFGAVLDFLDLHLGGLHWPAFNIADLGITIGLLLFLTKHVLKDFRK